METSEPTELRELVGRRYAAAAEELAAGRPDPGGCGGPAGCCGGEPGVSAPGFGGGLYGAAAAGEASAAALSASLGCGVPTAVADLHPGETVLDLGSGGGADVLIAARRVGTQGRAIGLDMTPGMVALARRHAAEAGVANATFVEGLLEDVPLPDGSVDVVISNCVINLTADKLVVLREAARVLRPGGRLAMSDVVADAHMDAATRADLAAWTGCIAGALTEPDYRSALGAAGFTDVEITMTHRVHPHAVSAIVRARRRKD